MTRKLKISLSSYIDGECRNPERVEEILKKNKEAKEIYAELSTSKKVKELDYRECSIPFNEIFLDKKREFFKQVLVTAGAVAIAILFLFPMIKNSYQNQQLEIKNLEEALK